MAFEEALAERIRQGLARRNEIERPLDQIYRYEGKNAWRGQQSTHKRHNARLPTNSGGQDLS